MDVVEKAKQYWCSELAVFFFSCSYKSKVLHMEILISMLGTLIKGKHLGGGVRCVCLGRGGGLGQGGGTSQQIKIEYSTENRIKRTTSYRVTSIVYLFFLLM